MCKAASPCSHCESQAQALIQRQKHGSRSCDSHFGFFHRRSNCEVKEVTLGFLCCIHSWD
jgi:hypothetical protein